MKVTVVDVGNGGGCGVDGGGDGGVDSGGDGSNGIGTVDGDNQKDFNDNQ